MKIHEVSDFSESQFVRKIAEIHSHTDLHEKTYVQITYMKNPIRTTDIEIVKFL